MSTRTEGRARQALAGVGMWPADAIVQAVAALAGVIEDEGGARDYREALEALRLAIAEGGEAESDDDAQTIAESIAEELRDLASQPGAWDARRSDDR